MKNNESLSRVSYQRDFLLLSITWLRTLCFESEKFNMCLESARACREVEAKRFLQKLNFIQFSSDVFSVHCFVVASLYFHMERDQQQKERVFQMNEFDLFDA